MIPFENDNVKAYRLLLRIEIAVRECLQKSMQEQFGARWKKQIPGTLRGKINEASAEEYRSQFNYLNLGPFYYLTLGELIPILQQKVGQPTAELFGGEKFIKQLENILGPRNAICHSRAVTEPGLLTIQAVYAQMESAVTAERLDEIISKPNIGVTPVEVASELLPWLEQVKRVFLNIPNEIPISSMVEKATVQFWWSDEELCGFDCTFLEKAVSVLQEYNNLPKGFGCAAPRQKLCDDHSLSNLIDLSIIEFNKVLP